MFCFYPCLLALFSISGSYAGYKTTGINNQAADTRYQILANLLNDKELLITEICYLVKNNLQMILGLLESQSTFLKNDALPAIQSRPNRVQSMFFIHQLFYLPENVTNIEMPDYLLEHAGYLADNFDKGGRIYFRVEPGRMTLEIAEAVPLGLTNAITYGFPREQTGKIFTRVKTEVHQQVELTVTDDGIALPQDLRDRAVRSSGMKLIRGLAGNLDGNVNITSGEEQRSTSFYGFGNLTCRAKLRWEKKY
jgi:two-component sensor histidine kinase